MGTSNRKPGVTINLCPAFYSKVDGVDTSLIRLFIGLIILAGQVVVLGICFKSLP